MDTFGSSAEMAGGRAAMGSSRYSLTSLAQRHRSAEVGKGVAERDHLAAELFRELANAKLRKIGLRGHLVR
jgi:hypothetical protein